MSIKGKQIIDSTITQPKLNLSEPINPNDAATKQYVDNNNSIEFNSISNYKLPALDTNNYNGTNGDPGQLATNTAILDQPVSGSGVSVYVNGIQVSCGNLTSDTCYFSPNGIYKRRLGNERQGDKLYWLGYNAGFNLDTNDVIDFNYVISSINNRTITLYDGDVYTYNTSVRQNLFTFIGNDGDNAIIVIDGTSFVIGNISDDFVFDIGNTNGYQHVFTTLGETLQIIINSTNYDIVLDSTSQFDFTITLS